MNPRAKIADRDTPATPTALVKGRSLVNPPFECIRVPGDRAIADLRDRSVDGVVPILLGTPADLNSLIDNLAFLRESPEAIVARADDVDPAAWYEQRHEDDPDAFAIDEGEWPEDATPCHDLISLRDPESGEVFPEVVIGKVPARNPWEIPAILGFGGWGSCPPPHEHVALFRRWHQHFGASVAAVVGGMIELEVERPPLDQDAAELLAMEHLLYCPGFVRPEEEPLADIASSLMYSTVWTFAW